MALGGCPPRAPADPDVLTLAGHLEEGARPLELDGGTEGIGDGQAEEGSALAIDGQHTVILPLVVAFASQWVY